MLTHINLALANSADQNQTPHSAASDQGFHCLLTGVSIMNKLAELREWP